jgi:hypothetical protein
MSKSDPPGGWDILGLPAVWDGREPFVGPSGVYAPVVAVREARPLSGLHGDMYLLRGDAVSDRYPCALAVCCDMETGTDECPEEIRADFMVSETDDRAARLGYILDYAAEQGWQVLGRNRPETALTYCPTHSTADHLERPVKMAGGKTYCSCGRPWPCPFSQSHEGWCGTRRVPPAPCDCAAHLLSGYTQTAREGR